MKTIFTVSILIYLCLWAGIAWGDTIHVATWGDDEAGDGSLGNPYQTIQSGSSPVIQNNEIIWNSSGGMGGGIVGSAFTIIRNNKISMNSAEHGGGGFIVQTRL